MGPMPWTVNAEIYPLWARSTCNSIATSANWFFNFLVSMTFLTLTEILTREGIIIKSIHHLSAALFPLYSISSGYVLATRIVLT